MSSSRGPRARSCPRSHAASYARIWLWPWCFVPVSLCVCWSRVAGRLLASLTRDSRLALRLRNNLLRDVLRHFLVVVELHRVHCPTLGHAAKLSRVPEHLGQRHVGRHNLCVTTLSHTADLATPAGQVADNVAQEVRGAHHLDLHDRLEQNRVRHPCGFLDRHRARDLECHFGAVNIVVAAEDQSRLDVYHRIAGENAVFEGFAVTCFDRFDELPRDDAADNLVFEHEAAARLARTEVDHHVSVLSLSARLPNELALDILDGLLHSLPECHLWLTDVRLDLELPLHTVDEDLEVQLAHARDDRLAGLRIGANPECRVLLLQLLERSAQLILVGLGLRLDRDIDDRIRELHGLQDD